MTGARRALYFDLPHWTENEGRMYPTREQHGEYILFGEPMGTCPWGVPAYSSDYDSANDDEHGDYISFHNGVYTGCKYQCVEYARRWLVAVKGITFPDVRMAYEVFRFRHFVRVSDETPIPVVPHSNGVSTVVPPVGAVLLWKPNGYFRHTGHIAIVTHVHSQSICVAEQNVYDRKWLSRNYSREIPFTVDAESKVLIYDNHPNTEVLGWVTYE